MNTYGLAANLYYQEENIPQIGSKELLVRVKAVAINPTDLKLISGKFKSGPETRLPVIIGSDFSGEVVALGDRVTSISKGMQIFGHGVTFAGGSGSMAEYVRVQEDNVGRIPENTDYATAAAIVTPGITAVEVITKRLQVKPGEKILIIGAGSPTGILATQLCLNIGAEVTVAVSEQYIPYMKKLGVDFIINRKMQSFAEILTDYDMAFDSTSNNHVSQIKHILKPHGRYFILNELNLLNKTQLHPHSEESLLPAISTQSLSTLRFLVEEEIITPPHPESVTFAEALAGIYDLLQGNSKKRILIDFTEKLQ